MIREASAADLTLRLERAAGAFSLEKTRRPFSFETEIVPLAKIVPGSAANAGIDSSTVNKVALLVLFLTLFITARRRRFPIAGHSLRADHASADTCNLDLPTRNLRETRNQGDSIIGGWEPGNNLPKGP